MAPNGQPERVDLESVALHELGHLLGLGHSAIGETERTGNGSRRVIGTGAVMFPIALTAGAIADRVLQADDIAGISDLYPAPPTLDTGGIVGRVTKNGQGVIGAHVVAFNPETGILVGNFTLNADGDFVIARLPPGPYILRVEPLDDADPDSFFPDGDRHRFPRDVCAADGGRAARRVVGDDRDSSPAEMSHAIRNDPPITLAQLVLMCAAIVATSGVARAQDAAVAACASLYDWRRAGVVRRLRHRRRHRATARQRHRPARQPFTLFTAESRLTSVTAPELRVGFAVTRRLALEFGVAVTRPRVGVAIAGDAEAPAQQLLGEELEQYLFDGGVTWQLPIRMGARLAPFVSGGADLPAAAARRSHAGRDRSDLLCRWRRALLAARRARRERGAWLAG